MTNLTASTPRAIQLTAKVTSLVYEYLSRVARNPGDLQRLIDVIKSFNRILATVQTCMQESRNHEPTTLIRFIYPIEEWIKEMTGLRRKLEAILKRKLSHPVSSFRENEITGCITRIEKIRGLFITTLKVDQLSHLSVTEGLRGGLPTGFVAYGQTEDEDTLRIVWEKRQRVLDWVYPEAFDKRHVEISNRRQKDTGGWVLRTPEVQDWIKENAKISLLWGYGAPGTGKTFLCSRVIDSLQDQTSVQSYGVAYIYFNYKEQDQQRPIHVIASLVKQLAYQLETLPMEIGDLYAKLKSEKRRPTFEQLYSILLTISESFTQTFVICDALDECDKKFQRNILLPEFHRMAKSGIKLLLTSREYPGDIQDSFKSSAKIRFCANSEDIFSYIEQKISENPRIKRLIGRGSSDYKDKIVSELKFCAQKMFLLAHIHIESLCQQPTPRKVFIELEKLRISSTCSKETLLGLTYDRAIEVLRHQSESHVELAVKVLSWLVKAQRTLTIQELQQAIAVEPSQYEIDDSDLPDKETILGVCAGLVVIDGNIVRLAHYTVQEYLLTSSLIPEDTDLKIAMACITFLSFDIFSYGACINEISLEVRRQIYPFLDYAAKNLHYHLGLCDEASTRDLLFRFITNSGNLSSYLQALNAQRWYSTDMGYHNRYIKRTPLHIAATLGHCSLVELLLEDASGNLDINAVNNGLGDKSAIHCAASRGHKAVVEVLLGRGVKVSDKIDGDQALHTAASGGRDTIVRLLLEEGANVSDIGFDGDTALHRAASNGHESAVRLLLDNGADVSTKAKYGMTALHRAASGGHVLVVQLLLDRGANPSSTGDGRETALHQAASRGHEQVVRILLDRGASISAAKTYGETALHHAASGGHERVVQLLLERGSNVGAIAAKNGGETALHLAASEGHRPVVKLLLENGADIAVTTRYGTTALQRAAYRGHESVVKLLLDKGANVSAATKYGTTALHRAALAGYESVVRLLLERGADPSASGEDGETALHEAASAGHYFVARLLLENGADIRASAIKNGGETALHKAAFGGHQRVVKLLLQHGADLMAATKSGMIPLHRAASSGHGSVARLLLEKDAGAQVSAAKDDGETPLHCAALGGYESIVELLLMKGAKASESKKDGETALHIAAFGGYESVVLLLLKNRANILAKTTEGDTAVDRALDGKHKSIVDFLKRSNGRAG